uniref:Uncharacterized protein n=1 Tax=Lactuca sativa TaxID=4236 RepID=A0A9R1USY1_LACSA|nr:hypothetical protein LSAT_V11C800451440 [Lactuca sativa]
MIKKSTSLPITTSPQVYVVATTGGTSTTSLPDIAAIQSQLNNLQLFASQLGCQLNPMSSQNTQTQAYYASRPSNNRDNQNVEAIFVATHEVTRIIENTVYGHCNRCSIGHLPSQCPNQPNMSNSQTSIATYSAATWFTDTGENSHATPNLSNLDNSEHIMVMTLSLFVTVTLFPLFILVHQNTFLNLLSVQQFCHDNDVYFEFHTSFFVVKDEAPTLSSFRVQEITGSTRFVFLNFNPFPSSPSQP